LAYWDLVPVRDNRALLQDIVLGAVREDRRGAATVGSFWRAPRTIVDAEAIRPVPGFSGRERELTALSSALTGDDCIAALHGLGGVGKSSVAREYAWQKRDDYSVIWWLNAQTEDAIVDALLRLGALLVRGLDRLADRRAAAQQLTSSLLKGFAKPALLVFDNLEDERLMHAWRPRTGSHVLVTSRNAAWGSDVTAIPLQTWPVETAIEYLQRESGRQDLGEAGARDIAQALGELPLALAHAAASLRGMRMVTPERYLARIDERIKNAPASAEYPHSVFATFSTAIAHAEKESTGAAAVLCFAASYAPDAIPDELFRQPLENYPDDLRPALSDDGSALDLRSALADDLRLDEARGALDRLSLLTFAPGSRTYTIHRLVQLAARDRFADAAEAWTECAVNVANAAFPKVEFATWPECERLLPHARAALANLSDDAPFLPASRVAERCALYLRERGEFAAAEPLQTRALAIVERAFGVESPEAASSTDYLAVIYWRQGRYADAEVRFAKALAILEKTRGPDHLDVATCLNDVGMVYFEQGRYSEPQPILERALAIREKQLGPEHYGVALVLNNLANLHCVQGHNAEGERLQIRTLEINEKALGPDHPRVATSLNNLGTLYEIQGRFGEAEPLLQRALQIWESAFGSAHPDLALPLHTLGKILHRLERYRDAEPLIVRSLALREKALGPDHPFVGLSLGTLAALYSRQGRHEDAEALFARALATLEKGLGEGHVELAETLSDLAHMRETQGCLNEAESLHERALAIREKAQGSDHELTTAVRDDLRDLRSRL
jgi:tetratricopeptide (TPR) repeat protein